MELQKVSLTIPRDLREKMEAERSAMSQRVGTELSLSQAAQSLLRRALTTENQFMTAPTGR